MEKTTIAMFVFLVIGIILMVVSKQMIEPKIVDDKGQINKTYDYAFTGMYYGGVVTLVIGIVMLVIIVGPTAGQKDLCEVHRHIDSHSFSSVLKIV